MNKTMDTALCPSAIDRICGTARAVLDAAVTLVYPPTCVACGGATGVPHTLCAGCWSGMRFIERPFCERLGTPFAVDLGVPLLSPAAIADPPVFERARAVARYDETARALVHRLKYGDRLELAQALGSMMARAGAGLARERLAVRPVPPQARPALAKPERPHASTAPRKSSGRVPRTGRRQAAA